jgi:hypothetical protein
MKGAALVAMLGAALTVWSMLVYVAGPLSIPGFSSFMLPAEMFGVPSELKSRGIEAHLKGNNTGWDGQFYYYQSNDIFAAKDTVSHIDNPPYRYQRIGVSLAAKLVSLVFFQDWVSPLTYYLTTLVISAFAVFVFARFLSERGYSPFWALAWIAGAGTQVTLLNALPDAVADAFLIIALTSLLSGRTLAYLICMSFSALSREAYVIFPVLIGAYCFVASSLPALRTRFSRDIGGNMHWLAVIAPAVPFVAWQIYVRMNIGSPSSGSSVVLGAPLGATLAYLKDFRYLFTSVDIFADARSRQNLGILLHTILLLVSVGLSLKMLWSNWVSRSAGVVTPVAGALLVLMAVYACFSDTVMMDWTGYFKADNMLLFLIPFIYVLKRERIPKYFGILSLVLVLYFWVPFYQRIDAAPLVSNNPSFSGVAATCKNDIMTKLELQEITATYGGGLFNRFFGQSIRSMRVKVTNASNYLLESTGAMASFNLGYQWVSRNSGDVVMDGARSFLSKPLPPGDAEILDFAIVFPEKKGAYDLVISPVEEGCVWLYRKSRQNALVLPFDVR